MPTKARSSTASKQRRQDHSRGTAHQRGYTSRWRRYSEQYRRANPLCVACKAQGKIRLAEHVDHIEAVSGPADPKFWWESNHQSLCQSCHSTKTRREGGSNL